MGETIRLIKPKYSIILKLDENDLSIKLESVLIINSIKSVYPIIIIKIGMSTAEFTSYKMSAKSNLYLNIMLMSEDRTIHENIEMDLIPIHIKIPFSAKTNVGNTKDEGPDEVNEDMITFICLIKSCYQAMFSDTNTVLSPKRKPDPSSSGLKSILQGVGNLGGIFKIGGSVGGNLNASIGGKIGGNVSISGNSSILSGGGNIDIKTAFGGLLNKYKNSDYNNYSTTSIQTNNEDITQENNISLNFKSAFNSFSNNEINQYNKEINTLNQKFGDSNKSLNLNLKNLISSVSLKTNNSTSSLKNMLNGLSSSKNGLNLTKIKNAVSSENNTNSNLSEGVSKTPYSIVKELYNKCIKDFAESKFISTNQNLEKLEQFTGIKKTFVSTIREIDNKYGIFNGPMFLYCNLDNQICLWDLSKIVDREPLYKIHFLTLNEKEDDIIKSGGKDNEYYTYDEMKINNKSNSDAMITAFKHTVLVKPKNKFFAKFNIDLENVSKNYSVSSGSNDFNDYVKNRTRFHNDFLVSDSENTSATIIKSKLAKSITSSLNITFKISGNLKIRRLSNVGQCIELNPHYLGYRDYQGNYIVGSSSILITRKNSEFYNCIAHISCFRQNVEG